MAINSINTSSSVFASLRSISSINNANSTTQNRVSTGLQVASALSNASSFAIGQGLRGELSGISALTQGLNATNGAASVANAGATGLSDLSSDIQVKLIELSNGGNTAQQNTILQNDLGSLLEQAQGFIANSSFNGTNLLESGATDLTTISSNGGDTVTVSAQGAVGDAVTALQGALGGNPATVLQNEFAAFETAVNTALGSLGADQRQISQQNESLQAISDATEEGLGNIVDANLGRESVRLASQSVQSQLSIQTFNIANQSSSSLLELFR
ncbi:MAG: flagellin [Proteobacteria bacterium]|nr:flagellin [Pseudomonadota bacterium]MDA1309538.1 flagellin [Pseudomonadota bacterium]